MKPEEATKITDLFSVGDHVVWVSIRRYGNVIDVKKHRGTIDEIIGSDAMIKRDGFSRRKRVSLFELKKGLL